MKCHTHIVIKFPGHISYRYKELFLFLPDFAKLASKWDSKKRVERIKAEASQGHGESVQRGNQYTAALAGGNGRTEEDRHHL